MYVRCHIYKEHFFTIYRKETINFYGYPPEWQPTFIRHVRRKLYLCVHEGNQYILAHYDLNDCDCEGLNGPFEMEGYHEEFEVCVCGCGFGCAYCSVERLLWFATSLEDDSLNNN